MVDRIDSGNMRGAMRQSRWLALVTVIGIAFWAIVVLALGHLVGSWLVLWCLRLGIGPQ